MAIFGRYIHHAIVLSRTPRPTMVRPRACGKSFCRQRSLHPHAKHKDGPSSASPRVGIGRFHSHPGHSTDFTSSFKVCRAGIPQTGHSNLTSINREPCGTDQSQRIRTYSNGSELSNKDQRAKSRPKFATVEYFPGNLSPTKSSELAKSHLMEDTFRPQSIQTSCRN